MNGRLIAAVGVLPALIAVGGVLGWWTGLGEFGIVLSVAACGAVLWLFGRRQEGPDEDD